ncbi:MAG TPA: fluoride efflux transporter CrcB [Verrucomicrobiales bacterium]|nr:fluoride efflux transporter CrcB [Verrucomicrobiales bacterium]
MRNTLLIFLGGGLGSVLRFWTVLAAQRCWPGAVFPAGVLVANLLGSFILGFLFAWPAMRARDAGAWFFCATGVLGGYTTFSTLAGDSLQLLLNNHPLPALLNAFGSITAGLLAAALGWQTARFVFG